MRTSRMTYFSVPEILPEITRNTRLRRRAWIVSGSCVEFLFQQDGFIIILISFLFRGMFRGSSIPTYIIDAIILTTQTLWNIKRALTREKHEAGACFDPRQVHTSPIMITGASRDYNLKLDRRRVHHVVDQNLMCICCKFRLSVATYLIDGLTRASVLLPLGVYIP